MRPIVPVGAAKWDLRHQPDSQRLKEGALTCAASRVNGRQTMFESQTFHHKEQPAESLELCVARRE